LRRALPETVALFSFVIVIRTKSSHLDEPQMNGTEPVQVDEPQMNRLMNGVFDLAPIEWAFLALRVFSVSM
jgi:hypothetical protein